VKFNIIWSLCLLVVCHPGNSAWGSCKYGTQPLGKTVTAIFNSSYPERDFIKTVTDIDGVFARYGQNNSDRSSVRTCGERKTIMTVTSGTRGHMCLQKDGKVFAADMMMDKISSGGCTQRFKLTFKIHAKSNSWVKSNICKLSATVCLIKREAATKGHRVVVNTTLYNGGGGGLFSGFQRLVGFGTVKKLIKKQVAPMIQALLQGLAE